MVLCGQASVVKACPAGDFLLLLLPGRVNPGVETLAWKPGWGKQTFQVRKKHVKPLTGRQICCILLKKKNCWHEARQCG